MAPKRRVGDARSSEERWFASQHEFIIKIKAFEAQSLLITGEMTYLEEQKLKHKTEADRLRYTVLQAGADSPTLLQDLRTLRTHMRWLRHWSAQLGSKHRDLASTTEAIDVLKRLLGSDPYPGEVPLVESEVEVTENELDTRDTARTAAELGRAEPAA